MDISLARGHVRSEARAIRESLGSGRSSKLYKLSEAIVANAQPRFRRGRKLRNQELETLVATTDAMLAEIDPTHLEQLYRPPARMSPGKEAYERLVAFVEPVQEAGIFDINTLRVFANRRLVKCGFTDPGLEISFHAVQRSLERWGTDAGQSPIQEVALAVVKASGLLAINLILAEHWNQEKGINLRWAIPGLYGLLLGDLHRAHPDHPWERGVDANMGAIGSVRYIRHHPLLEKLDIGVTIKTYVHDYGLLETQRDFKTRLLAFMEKHALALEALAIQLLWRESELLKPAATPEQIQQAIIEFVPFTHEIEKWRSSEE
jgi:hypothetical protein